MYLTSDHIQTLNRLGLFDRVKEECNRQRYTGWMGYIFFCELNDDKGATQRFGAFLLGAFEFGDTKEGARYWRNVIRRGEAGC
jgi:hypothetical protein